MTGQRCPKCNSTKTAEQREADEYYCFNCFNTFYDTRRVISEIRHVLRATGPNPKKAKPTISGVREVYKKVGVV